MNNEIKELELDYQYEDHGVFTDSVLTILDELSPTDKRLFILYAEHQSYRKVAEIVGASHTLAGKNLTRIKQLLQRRLKEI